MIYKNAKYGEVENVTILEFGKGDILVCNASNDKYKHESIIFKSQDPTPIGTEDSTFTGKTTNEYAPEVMMIFTKPESIDVVIDHLQKCKDKLINQR
jgi:hypothetical protein